jgi:hypothetical protein
MIRYFIPAFLASATHSLASKPVGLNVAATVRYSSTGIWVAERRRNG